MIRDYGHALLSLWGSAPIILGTQLRVPYLRPFPLLFTFTFDDDYDGVTCYTVCPRGVGDVSGSDVINMASSSSASSDTMTHLLLNATFPCRAYIRSWTYFRSRDTPRVFASVWRKEPAADNYFRLVGVNVLPVGDVGWHQVVIMKKIDRIAVKSGDFIGFHYSGADVYRYWNL